MGRAYEIIKVNEQKYKFITENDIEYQIKLKNTSMNYQTLSGEQQKIYEISLNGMSTAPRDLKTGLTIIEFLRQFMAGKNDAIMYRVHNKMEAFKKDRRRGDLRKILFDRLMRYHGQGYIALSNSVFNPPPDDELFCIVVDVNTPNYNKVVESFYRFCDKYT